MFPLVDERKVLSFIDSYYIALEKTGYVKHSTVSKLLLYEFLTDFIENVIFFVTDEDYVKIDSLLKKLFTNGGCLMPYQVLCTNRVELSKYRGSGDVRITEDKYRDKDGNLIGNEIRVTEDWNLRIV